MVLHRPIETTRVIGHFKLNIRYYSALTSADSNNAPFADDCVRHESGGQSTGNPPPATPSLDTLESLGCAAQLKTHTMDYITRIEPVRVTIADPEMGLVFGLSHFRQPMKEKSKKIVGVPGVTVRPLPYKPFDLRAAHIFKVYGGQIHENRSDRLCGALRLENRLGKVSGSRSMQGRANAL